MKTEWAIAVLLCLWSVSAGHASDHVKAFPPAEEGMARYVLQLPGQEDESVRRVELFVGKTIQIDERNRYFFTGRIEEESIPGWGYTRYKVSSLGVMGGSLMAVDPGAPRVARFISLGGEPYFIRYNSRVPIVIYVPEGAEVRYRIWTAGAEIKAIEKG